MAKYVVKNERGEWLTWIGLWCGPWSQYKELGGRTSSRAEAFEWKRKYGGRVYRVRKVTARRERYQITSFMARRLGTSRSLETRAVIAELVALIGRGEHRRKPCRNT